MGDYTEYLRDRSEEIFDKSDLKKEFKRITEFFRTFDRALDAFIIEKGYSGEASVAAKIDFIESKFKKAGIKVPRSIESWYKEHKSIERKTGFQLCFAFELNIEEVDDFFRRICIFGNSCGRSFDYHDPEEIIYFFCFKNGLKYKDAVEMLEKLPKYTQGRIDAAGEAVYTEVIYNEIDAIETKERLTAYLSENTDKFAYNNVTALKAIAALWNEIAGPHGLAEKERKRELYAPFDMPAEGYKRAYDQKRKKRETVDDSVWEIYLRILGLEGTYTHDLYKARSIKEMIRNNSLLHYLAENAFPDRDGIQKIINGVHVSYERVRKIYILLLFYSFWVRMALKNLHYQAEDNDILSFYDYVDDCLNEAGYPELYPGNPYDFIIFSACESCTPLLSFRSFMQEIYRI